METCIRRTADQRGENRFIVPGNATGTRPSPITFECAPPQLRRWSGYPMSETQPTSFAGGTMALLADNVASCAFDYQQSSGVGPRIGLLTLQITLRRTRSDGAPESVTLYHAVHVNNVP